VGVGRGRVDLLRAPGGTWGDHEGLGRVETLRVLPQLRAVGVFPHRVGPADLLADNDLGVAGRDGGEVGAPRRERREGEGSCAHKDGVHVSAQRRRPRSGNVISWRRWVRLTVPVFVSNSTWNNMKLVSR